MGQTIEDLQVSMKYMANNDKYVYGSWKTTGNGSVGSKGDGWHWDCATAPCWCIRDALNNHQHDNSPLSWYSWPNNDGDANFDNYYLNHGMERHYYNLSKALNSEYEVVFVVGRYHNWTIYSTSQKLVFEANDSLGAGAASISIHALGEGYSDALYMYYPVGWDKGTSAKKKAGLQNQAESDGKWAYYTDGKIDTSVTTVAQNVYGWWYVKNGYVDFTYYGLAQNQYGWWVIEGGKVNFNAKTGFYGNEHGWWWCEGGKVMFDKNELLRDPYDGNWVMVKGGKLVEGYNGICANSNGLWRMVDGKVDFTPGTYTVTVQVQSDGLILVNPKDLEA